MQTKAVSKEGLRQAIIAKRHARGDADIQIDFREPEKMDHLTPQDKAKRERRKEQNRRAAQRCRFKKRQNQNKVLQTFQNILDSNKDLRDEMQILRVERDNLQMAWTNHRTTCPLFASAPGDASCAIKMETSCAIKTETSCEMHNVIPCIKQETPPHVDCMAGSNLPLSSGLTPGNENSRSYPPYYYPYKDQYRNPQPYPQQLNQHYTQQQQQLTQSIPHNGWSLNNSYQVPGNQYVGPVPDNRTPGVSNPISPNSKSTVPFSHPHMQPQPHRYDNMMYQRSNNVNNIPRENQASLKDHLQSKLQSQAATNIITTPPAFTSKSTMSTSSPTPKLVSQYPDLCRKLQRPPVATAASQIVPSVTRHLTHNPGPNSGIMVPHAPPPPPIKSELVSPCGGNQMNQSKPHLKSQVPQHSKMVHNVQKDSRLTTTSPKTEQINSPVSCSTPINTPSPMVSGVACSMDNPSTPSSCLYVSSCIDNNESFFTDVRRPSDAGSVPDNVLSIHQEVPLMDSSDLDTDDVFDTAFALEKSYNLSCENGLSPYSGNQDGVSSNIVSTESNGLNQSESSTYSTSAESSTSSIMTDSSRGQGQTNGFIDASMADDLSDIPSKELLFFPQQNYCSGSSDYPTIATSNFLE